MLAGCAAPSTVADMRAPVEGWFRDALFAPPAQPIDDAIFEASGAMRTFVQDGLSRDKRWRDSRQALLDALSDPRQLKLRYDNATTRGAHDTFVARAGNCLSLVIMTASLADLLGIPVRFNSVLLEESWSRSDNVYFASGHVNLTLSRSVAFGDRLAFDAASDLTVDFLPPSDLRGQRVRAISRETVLAMYLNNRAAEALAAKEVDEAYWWARRAIERVPHALTAYNTLGVIYMRRGALAEAEALFRHVRQQEPDNTKALFNLVQVLERQGRREQVAALRARLSELESHPPFHFFDQGLAALAGGRYEEARRHFQRELDRSSEYHEFHFGLALAAYHLRDFDAAYAHLKKAAALSGSPRERELYASKSQALRTLER